MRIGCSAIVRNTSASAVPSPSPSSANTASPRRTISIGRTPSNRTTRRNSSTERGSRRYSRTGSSMPASRTSASAARLVLQRGLWRKGRSWGKDVRGGFGVRRHSPPLWVGGGSARPERAALTCVTQSVSACRSDRQVTIKSCLTVRKEDRGGRFPTHFCTAAAPAAALQRAGGAVAVIAEEEPRSRDEQRDSPRDPPQARTRQCERGRSFRQRLQ